ncbi:MAG: class I SAM-dependent methyltransferase [Elusimicrobiota bacterium]|nr:class I SAM-dependent methyltransferase [Elusimicrobiota bacterium]
MKMHTAKSLACQIVFAPMIFQAVNAMLKTNFLKSIDEHSHTGGLDRVEIENKLQLSSYAVSVLCEAAESIGLLYKEGGKFFCSKLAQVFLYDKMTQINLDFVQDVCYKGSFYLTESLINQKPEGLKVFGKTKTIYEMLDKLDENVSKSWFAFDHFYSDNTFNQAAEIILKTSPKTIFDVGANTGRFERVLFSKNFSGKVVLVDLPSQIKMAKQNLKNLEFSSRVEFYEMDVLDPCSKFLQGADAIFMSQFLDCFSKEQIVFILAKAKEAMAKTSRLFILEPLIDGQRFEAAKLSLSIISLYFTAIANGKSKMYESADLIECINLAGLKIIAEHNELGVYDYTMFECGL